MRLMKIRKAWFTLKKYYTKIKEYLIQFCDESSLHGFKHLIAPNRHSFEQIFWYSSVSFAFLCLSMLMMNIYDRYQNSPTVISMERDNLSWNISFPTATMCFSDVNEAELRELSKELNVNTTDILNFVTFLVGINLDSMTDDIIDDSPEIPPERYLEVINRVAVGFPAQILSSLTEPIRIQKMMTEFGLCYAINSKVAIYYSPEYWFQRNWSYIQLNDIDINFLDGDQFVQLTEFDSDYKILLHSTSEIPQALDHALIGSDRSLRISRVRALDTYSTEDVRYLSLKQRKCRYLDERILTRSPVYSYNMCIVECRARKTLEVCGCLPHFYRPLPNERICKISEFRCIALYKSLILAAPQEKKKCHCLSTCESTFYTIYDDTTLPWERLMQVKYGIQDYPKFRLKREVIFGIKEVVINWGGAAGLLLGCSVLSMVEILYFFTLRLFRFCVNRRI